jgi:hypothetical protein
MAVGVYSSLLFLPFQAGPPGRERFSQVNLPTAAKPDTWSGIFEKQSDSLPFLFIRNSKRKANQQLFI